MNRWFSLALGDALTAHRTLAEIQGAFASRCGPTGLTPEQAVLTRHDSEGRLHCEVTAYFSPAAAGLAREFGAHACVQPDRRGLDLLAGDPHCWASLFGEITPAPHPG
jgi:hypothetical protein